MQRRPLVRLLALLVLLTACGQAPFGIDLGLTVDADAIIGGVKAVEGEYPAVGVQLFVAHDSYYGDDYGGMLCTGTLIAPDVVLLASHCVDTETVLMELFGTTSRVTLTYYFSFSMDVTDYGYSTMTLPADTYEVTTTLMHPQYDASDFNTFAGGLADFHDVALMFLGSAVTDRDPAVVLGPNDSGGIILDAPVKIAGYGVRDANYDPYSTNPDAAGIKYIATSLINEIGDSEMQIGNTAPTPQKCHGDSGGPSFLTFTDNALPKERLIGITSHAYDETDCHSGGVDTRADAYRFWIDSEMKKACTDSVRVSCQGGGGLPVAVAPSSTPASEYIQNRDDEDEGCSATGGPSAEVALVLALFLALRHRRSAANLRR